MNKNEYIIQHQGKIYKGTIENYMLNCRIPRAFPPVFLEKATAKDLIEYNERFENKEGTNQ